MIITNIKKTALIPLPKLAKLLASFCCEFNTVT